MKKNDNLYLFIIWNKALFARNKILNDLRKDFEIVTNIYVEWKKECFESNLQSFYGRKISNVKDKIDCIGTGKFNVIVVKDNNPNVASRKTHDGDIIVNTNVFDRKDLYREWTGRSFRIHSSSNKEEFQHDMVVLFGSEYIELLGNITENLIEKNTKTVEGFINEKDLLSCLKLFGNNKCYTKNKINYIFSKCRLDVERFIKNNSNVKIYGEAEGDIPEGMVDKCDDDLVAEFLKIKNDYDEFLISRNPNKKVVKFLRNINFDVPIKKESIRISPKTTIKDKMKREIKYTIARVKNGKE